jgi:hypothetical protein
MPTKRSVNAPISVMLWVVWAVLWMVSMGVPPAYAQEPDSGVCLTRDAADQLPVELPPNARLIVQMPGESLLQLVDPRDNTQSHLPNTNEAEYLLFTSDARQALVVTRSGTYFAYYVVNMDGSQGYRVRASRLTPYNIRLLTDDSVLVAETFGGAYRVLNLTNGETRNLVLPELRDQEGAVNYIDHAAERVAYFARDERQSIVLRILSLGTGQTVDIDVLEYSPVWWSATNNSIGLYNDPGFYRKTREIYNNNNGSLRYRIEAPSGITHESAADDLTWSPGDRVLAIHYWDGSWTLPNGPLVYEQGAVYLFDLREGDWLGHCFQIEQLPEGNDFYLASPFHWTPDGRFLWWMEKTGQDSDTYDLVVADVQTGAFSAVAAGVGRVSGIGFVGEENAP